MKSIGMALILGCSISLLAGCNGNDPSPNVGASPDAATLYYLTPNSIPVGTWLPTPPAQNSAAEQADLNTLLSLQETRTAADCARAKTEVNITPDAFYGPAYGPLTADEIAALTPFLSKIQNDGNYAASVEKTYWKRPRPYLVDSTIDPCIQRETSYAYPSGHSTISHTMAAVLDVIFPERKTEIDARADQIAEDRVMGGVHYPTDIAAGVQMSERVFQAIQLSDAFQRDLKAAEASVHSGN